MSAADEMSQQLAAGCDRHLLQGCRICSRLVDTRAIRAEMCIDCILASGQGSARRIAQAKQVLAEVLEGLGPVSERHQNTPRGRAKAGVAKAVALLNGSELSAALHEMVDAASEEGLI